MPNKKKAPSKRGGTTVPLVSEGDIAAREVAGLVLVRRAPSGRTEWAFPERALNAPRLMGMPAVLHQLESSARVLSGEERERYWWWITDGALEAIARGLKADGFFVLDSMLGHTAASALRDEVAALRASGKLQSSRLAGGRSGKMLTYTHAAVRGDMVSWFDGEEAGCWPRGTLERYLTKLDTLIAQLGEHVPQLAAIGSRSKAMVACYPGGGARYIRHCDNSCDSGHGERCNGRRLTAILYLNEAWKALDGGELRLFEPYAPKGRPPLADVQPLFDRLLLFYADYRVPHEVLPAHAERLAVTVWYFDSEEYKRARSRGEAADQVDTTEASAIEAEIAKFESRFGAGAVRHGE